MTRRWAANRNSTSPATQSIAAGASKLITSFPASLAGGKPPAVQAVCVVFDGSSGRPLAEIDRTEITYWRQPSPARSLLSVPVRCRIGW